MRWNPDPLIILVLAGAFIACRFMGARTAPLVAGFAVLLLLFVSPLCALSSALFSVRVGHHVALMAIAAPLIAWALPRGGGHLATWTAAHALIFWVWHAPSVYALALADTAVFWLMQASIAGSAIGFWRAVRSAPATSAVAGLLLTTVQMGLLGALLTFAAKPLYGWHFLTTQPWGLTPLEDQQLAGLIMWVPGAGLYLAAALWSLGGLLGDRQRRAT